MLFRKFLFAACLLSPITLNANKEGSPSYVLATGVSAAHRLALSEKAYGEATKTLLKEWGSMAGKNVLIVACGTGEQLPWLSQEVGPKGHVKCTDISPAQIEVAKTKANQMDLKNVSFEVFDVLTHQTTEKFDLVTSRFVLVHLRNPKKAIQQMRSWVKKGGILLCEEHDISLIRSFPESDAIKTSLDLLYKIAAQREVDFTFGSKMLKIFNEAGFKTATMRLSVPTFNRGEEKRLLPYSLAEGKKNYVDGKLATNDQMEALIKKLHEFSSDETTWISLGGFFQVFDRVN